MDICLVSMPFPSLERPSLGLSILSASAKKEGFSVKTLYECFAFAEKIGYDAYSTVSQDLLYQIGEWAFSGCFPEFNPDHNAYFELLSSRAGSILHASEYESTGKHERIVSKDFLWEIRRKAVGFIHESAERILHLDPKILACTTMFQQNNASLALCREIKKQRPDIVTILGGTSCDGDASQVIARNFPEIDFVVSGEADLLFTQLCNSIVKAGINIPGNEIPNGVICKKTLALDKTRGYEAPIAIVDDLDNTPFPDFDDYFLQVNSFKYNKLLMPHVAFETSRGCWWHEKSGGCTFCSSAPNRLCFRSKSANRVMEEIRSIVHNYKIKVLMATDEILDPDYFNDLLPRIADKDFPDCLYFFEIKANIKEEQAIKLSQAGIRWVQPGIESLHDEALKYMKKGTTAAGNIYLLKLAYENGIRLMWHILYAFPGEDDDWYKDMSEFLPLLYHLNPPDALTHLHLDRYSHYHKFQEKFNLELIPHRSSNYCFPIPEKELNDFVRFFEDKTLIEENYPDSENIKKLRSKINEWHELFPANNPVAIKAHLIYKEHGQKTLIEDTRPCALKKEIVLDGYEHLVHKACREPVHENSLFKKVQYLSDSTVDKKMIEKAIDYLIEHKLLFSFNKRFISLSTKEPTLKLPTFEEIKNKYYQN
ncbi:MAG: RiPP maturation radical SAM C-methyltransferase [Bacteroidales bacterium]|nr:RiPP maturation radical SAM C-methyltransferase [Bacteroidales bacterium]